MTLFFRTVLVAFSICLFAPGGVARAEDGDKAAEEEPNPSTTGIPEPMIWRRPNPDATVCQPYTIDTRFKLNPHMMEGDRHAPGVFTLYVDGRDVRRDVTFFASQVIPETHVAVLHAMYAYKPGPHRARIEYPDAEGKRTHYEWSFSIGEDCTPQTQ